MARPRLYHTPEEKKAANRVKRAKHYERNRGQINARRKEKYGKKAVASSLLVKLGGGVVSEKLIYKGLNVPTLAQSLLKAELAYKSFLDGLAPTDFVNSAYIAYAVARQHPRKADGNILDPCDALTDPIETLESIHTTIASARGQLLQTDGIGEGWRHCDTICQEIRCLIRWLEDILCYALMDDGELADLYSRAALQFQST